MRNLIFGIVFAMVMQVGFGVAMLIIGSQNSYLAWYAVGGVFSSGIYILIDLL
jgi:hypothetical protein